jgi:hypothetical protein
MNSEASPENHLRGKKQVGLGRLADGEVLCIFQDADNLILAFADS